MIDERRHLTAVDSAAPRDYVVVFLDVLGFSQRVHGTSLQRLVSDYQALLRDIAWNSETPVFKLPAGGVDRWYSRTFVASDSLFLWAVAEHEPTMMLLTAASRILGRAAEMGWPLRGTVAAGECVIDQAGSIVVGAPIVRAVQLEKSQDWIGCGVDPAALTHPVAGAHIRSHPDIVWYPVPVKQGCEPIDAALWWLDSAPDAPERLGAESAKVGPSLQAKYDAAIAFAASSPVRIVQHPPPMTSP